MSKQATEFIVKLLIELRIEPSEENVFGFKCNHPLGEIEEAATGDVESIAAIRQRCGLPAFI